MLRMHTIDFTIWNNEKNRMILDNILNRIIPIEKEITLYSGAEIPINNIKFNTSLGLTYFTSSYNKRIAHIHAKSLSLDQACLFVLTIPIGSKIICLDNISAHGDVEHEVILSGKASLYVKSINNYHDSYVIVNVDYKDD